MELILLGYYILTILLYFNRLNNMDSALNKMNTVVYSPSSETTQKVYNAWFKTYDEDSSVLGFGPPHQAAKMFAKYAMNSNVALDIAGGENLHPFSKADIIMYKYM